MNAGVGQAGPNGLTGQSVMLLALEDLSFVLENAKDPTINVWAILLKCKNVTKWLAQNGASGQIGRNA